MRAPSYDPNPNTDMDPNATLNAIMDCLDDGKAKQAGQHACDLLEWLNKGGFCPDGMTKQEARHLCLAVRDAAENGQTLTT